MSVTTSHHSRFPLELYDLIIDELAASNSPPIYSHSHPELQTCLIVSRSFRHRACLHLFSGIRIDEEDAPLSDEPLVPTVELEITPQMIHDRLEQLVDIMRPPELPADSPCVYGIRPYIRHVYFGLRAVGAIIDDNNDSDMNMADSEIARQSRVYALAILDMLRNPPSVSGSRPLESFYIGGRGSEYTPEWNNITSPIRASLLNLIRCTEGLSLRVDWMDRFPRHILRGTKVRSVDFRDVLLFDLDHHGPVDLVDFPEYDKEGGVALLPLSSLDSATIRDAELLSPFCEKVYPKNPTDETPRTLNKLAVELLSFEDFEHLNQISQEFPALKTLNMFTSANDYDDEDPEEMPTYPFNLRGLRSLERIEIFLNCELAPQARPRYGFSPGVDSDPGSDSESPLPCSASRGFGILIPLMSRILRSCANDSVSEIWLSFCELSIRQRLGPGGRPGLYDLDLRVFRELDMLLSGASSSHSASTPTSASSSSLSHVSGSNLFPSLRRCIIETVIYPEDILLVNDSMDDEDDLRDPQQIELVREAERRKLEDFIRGGFPGLAAPSSTVVLDLRITFGRRQDL